MVKKDWTKHKLSGEGRGLISYVNKDGTILDITLFHGNNPKKKKWVVDHRSTYREFKTKPQALKFAKAYMRKN